jgi:hypothetical protein
LRKWSGIGVQKLLQGFKRPKLQLEYILFDQSNLRETIESILLPLEKQTRLVIRV